MDLFSKNKSHEGTEELISYEIKEKKGSKLLFDFIPYCTVTHGDKTTNLIKARVYEKYQYGHTVIPDAAKYICFELSQNITLEDLATDNVFGTLDRIGKLEKLEEKRYNHIGIIEKMQDGKYELYAPTVQVLDFIQSKMNAEIGSGEKALVERIKDKKENFKQKIDARPQVEAKRKVRERRKEKPYLEEQFKYNIGDKVYQDYKGIDLNDGRIINLTRLSQIYKEQNNNLYSAYIEKSVEESEEQITLQSAKGFPILFNSRNEWQKMIEDGKLEQILQLLSDIPEEVLTTKDIQYIGGLDAIGRIHYDMDNCSDEMKEQIKRQKEDYKKELKARSKMQIR